MNAEPGPVPIKVALERVGAQCAAIVRESLRGGVKLRLGRQHEDGLSRASSQPTRGIDRLRTGGISIWSDDRSVAYWRLRRILRALNSGALAQGHTQLTFGLGRSGFPVKVEE